MYPQPATMMAVQIQAPGRQEVSLNFGMKLPMVSCSMKRATRVPASTAVRMNSASNMMAKWYQKPIMAGPAEPLLHDVGDAHGQGGGAAGARDDAIPRPRPRPGR